MQYCKATFLGLFLKGEKVILIATKVISCMSIRSQFNSNLFPFNTHYGQLKLVTLFYNNFSQLQTSDKVYCIFTQFTLTPTNISGLLLHFVDGKPTELGHFNFMLPTINLFSKSSSLSSLSPLGSISIHNVAASMHNWTRSAFRAQLICI